MNILIEATSRTRPDSFASAVLNLQPGESASRVKRIDPDLTMADLAENLADIRQAFRNSIAPSVKVATAKTGNAYTVEVSEVMMPKGTMYSVGIVTCLEV